MERNTVLLKVKILYFQLPDIQHAYVYVCSAYKFMYRTTKEINKKIDACKKSKNF